MGWKEIYDFLGQLQNMPKVRELAELLKSELDLARQRNEELKKTITHLEGDIERWRIRCAKMKEELRRASSDFIAREGVLWKRSADGSIDPAPHCPRCRIPMTSPSPAIVYSCDECPMESHFLPRDAADIRASITAE